MDAVTLEMVLTAYDETVHDALSGGRSDDVADAEGLTAAAMLLAAVGGVEDGDARRQVAALKLRERLAA